MTEVISAGITLNGRELDGRTYRHEDGSYKTLDLSDVPVNDFITIITDKGDKYQILRTNQGSILEGWRLLNDTHDRYGGWALTLILLEPNPQGQSFWHHGIVASEELELGVKDNEQNLNIINNLGRMAAILPSDFNEKAATNTPDLVPVKV